MPETLAQFTALGSPRALARSIEQFAAEQGSLSAIVVPWEGDKKTVSMAVTAVRIDGWAIEHTNLGTVTLADLANDLTNVTIAAQPADSPEKTKLTALFQGFAIKLQSKFRAAS